MNTEYMFLYLVLVVYMLVNVVTDYRIMKTKNLWHLVIFLIGLIYSITKGELLQDGLLLVISFVLSGLLRKIPQVDLGYGDMKMLVVTSFYLSLLGRSGIGREMVLMLIFFTCYIVLSFLITLILKAIINVSPKEKITFGSYSISRSYIETPEAIPIFIVCMFIPLIL